MKVDNLFEEIPAVVALLSMGKVGERCSSSVWHISTLEQGCQVVTYGQEMIATNAMPAIIALLIL